MPKGEIAVRPKAQPQTEPKADNPTSPTENVPSPYKPNQPSPPQFDPTKLIPPIVGAGTTSIGKVITDKVNESDIAPNGVKNINKREWSQEEYQKWFDSLPTKQTPANEPHDIYEIIQTGDKNYKISGGGKDYWADGITDKTVLDAKFVGNPRRSPYVENSEYPSFLRPSTEAKLRDEFERMSKILHDDKNPLTSVRIITNEPDSVPYFERLMREYKIPGEVIVKKETDIIEK